MRGEGVHAAGVVICRDPLHYHTPVKRDTKGEAIITQYEGTLIADLGLLKMDFLGLRTLTVIAKALAAIEANHGVDIDIDDHPDGRRRHVRAAAARRHRRRVPGRVAGHAAACSRTSSRRCSPTSSPSSRCTARARWTTIPDFVERKHGRTPVTYYDDRLKPILEETYGAMVYQEQVMRISMEMAGFSAAKADKLRKAHGQEERATIIDALKPEFVEGAVERGYDKQARRAASGPTSRSSPSTRSTRATRPRTALITYQTAYLKAHYPLEFMAAVLTSYTGKTEEIVKYVAACNRARHPGAAAGREHLGHGLHGGAARASASGSPASAAWARASST